MAEDYRCGNCQKEAREKKISRMGWDRPKKPGSVPIFAQLVPFGTGRVEGGRRWNRKIDNTVPPLLPVTGKRNQ